MENIMHEYTVNLHMHTTYSDGTGSHSDIANAAIKAGIDAVIVTDHNVWVQGVEGYFGDDQNKVLVLVGEEIHDQVRSPQKNHLLVFGVEKELEHLAADPQNLINAINKNDGLSFLAHPYDPESQTFGEENLSWVDWDIDNFTGIELWNSMSEFKSLLTSHLPAIFYAFNFKRVARGPFSQSISIWDRLLAKGKPVVAVGGSDAHNLLGKLGPISRNLFPYEWHFGAINTHILASAEFSGDPANDRTLVYQALRQGHCYLGYDLPASTKGFHFSAQTKKDSAIMGDTIQLKDSPTLQVKLPQTAEFHLLKDGKVIASYKNRETAAFHIDETGVYRVEVYINYKGRRRAWIFSNPIYVR
ncbi:MAG: PHP domain-containing protein [Chloroflexi bacterium]|nr:PHP domain-containing protein [Chloroflexota bacterium]MBT4533623.1 PHP domain-containing protein [Chloroflexota bacterium]MBT4681734.1 PHP domain-containing protein [Chloroflexota bacterium]MBT4756513.1 PHP domain-containing protein [Chloroflexota bacterium]MBT6152212.1 PHP domain-containing protein [Chloroflexota bacterium]